jgi:hypothetical protein
MAAALVPDALWGLIESILPSSLPKLQGGRPRHVDRAGLPRGHHIRYSEAVFSGGCCRKNWAAALA